MVIIFREQDSRLLLIAYKTCGSADKISSLHSDRHIGYKRIDLFVILFRIHEGLFHDLLVRIDLDRNAVRILKDLVPVLI